MEFSRKILNNNPKKNKKNKKIGNKKIVEKRKIFLFRFIIFIFITPNKKNAKVNWRFLYRRSV